MTHTLKSKERTAPHDLKRIEEARKDVAARNKEEKDRAWNRDQRNKK